MIRILIVDDDEKKVAAIEAVVRQISREIAVDLARTGSAAFELFKAVTYDLVVLDLMLPLREGEDARADGGRILFETLQRRSELNKPRHVICLSAYDDVMVSNTEFFDNETSVILRYDVSANSWKDRLARRIVYIAEGKQDGRTVDAFKVDLCIVTALTLVELEAVLALPAAWTVLSDDTDDTIYHRGTFSEAGRKVSVVCAAATEMGMPAATALAVKIIHTFRPRYLAMVGIAAGVKGAFGDVLVATQSWDYGSGKRERHIDTSIFRPSPFYLPLDPVMLAKLNHFMMTFDPRQLVARWDGSAPIAAVSIRQGPIASGASVVADRQIVESILALDRKLIGVEMEIYGVFMAARVSTVPRPKVLAAKSLCDFGDNLKDDEHQRFAAHTSAAFIYEFALAQLSREQ
jgi:nucleoside phosphorylase/CheY-like chemotaxis protein